MALTQATADVIADGSVTAAKLAAGALSADTTGRGKMADGFVNTAKLADGALSADTTGRAKMADAFVNTAKLADGALSADSTGRAKMADGFLTQAKVAAGVGATGPAFSAYRSTSQSATSGVALKVQFDTEEFDTASAYDNASNYRFTPQVAGYYQITGRVGGNATTASSSIIASIYKNGSSFKAGALWTSPGGLQGMTCGVSALVYLNGSTDYVELYATPAGSGTVTISAGASATYFQGALVRAA